MGVEASGERDPKAWVLLASECGGGTVGGVFLAPQLCYTKALLLESITDALASQAWCQLGVLGGGYLPDSEWKLAPKECFIRGLERAQANAMAWCNLGHVGGGTVAGLLYSAEECIFKAHAHQDSIEEDGEEAVGARRDRIYLIDELRQHNEARKQQEAPGADRAKAQLRLAQVVQARVREWPAVSAARAERAGRASPG